MPKARPIPAAVPTAPLRVNASLPLMVRLEELVRYDRKVRDPANEKEAHDMRIAVKRLRYTLEIFATVVEGSDGFLKTLKALQAALGALHDADVLLPLLRDRRLERERGERGQWQQAIRDHALKERANLYCAFLEAWDGALAEGFAIRLWEAAIAASEPPEAKSPPAPASAGPADGGLLPPRCTRRMQMAVALLRLAPYAASSAPPDDVRRLRRAMERLNDAAVDPDMDETAWWKAASRFGNLLAAE